MNIFIYSLLEYYEYYLQYKIKVAMKVYLIYWYEFH